MRIYKRKRVFHADFMVDGERYRVSLELLTGERRNQKRVVRNVMRRKDGFRALQLSTQSSRLKKRLRVIWTVAS